MKRKKLCEEKSPTNYIRTKNGFCEQKRIWRTKIWQIKHLRKEKNCVKKKLQQNISVLKMVFGNKKEFGDNNQCVAQFVFDENAES